MAKNRHKGVCVTVWLSEEINEKLEKLAAIAGQSKSQMVRMLIEGKAIQDRSYWHTVNWLSAMGRQMRNMGGREGCERLCAMGGEVVKVARKLWEACYGSADSGEDSGE